MLATFLPPGVTTLEACSVLKEKYSICNIHSNYCSVITCVLQDVAVLHTVAKLSLSPFIFPYPSFSLSLTHSLSLSLFSLSLSLFVYFFAQRRYCDWSRWIFKKRASLLEQNALPYSPLQYDTSKHSDFGCNQGTCIRRYQRSCKGIDE